MTFDLSTFVEKYRETPGIRFTDDGIEQTYDEAEADCPGIVEAAYLAWKAEEKQKEANLAIA